MPPFRLQAAVAYLVALAACAQAYSAQSPSYFVSAMQQPAVVADWAMDPERRRVFAALPDAAAIAVHDPQTGKEINRLTVTGRPVKLFVTKGQLIVVSSGPEIQFFDVNTLKPTGVLSGAGQPFFATMATPDAPYLYVMSTYSPGGNDSALLQIDLATRTIRNRFNWWERRIRLPNLMAVSRSGDLLVTRYSREFESGNADLYRFDEEIFQLDKLSDLITPPGGMKGDLIMSRWWIGSTLKEKQLKEVVRQFPGELTVVHPLYDLTLSIEADVTIRERLRGNLKLSRYSDGAAIKDVTLPWPAIPLDAPAYPNYDDETVRLRRLVIDRSGNFVLAAAGSNALVIDLQRVGPLNLQPLLQIDWPADLVLHVGELIAVPLELTNPGATDKATFTLTDAPQGIQLDGKTIRWRPTPADVGRHEFAVKVSSGANSDTSRLALEVQVPNLTTGVMAQQLVADPGGKFACVLGQKAEVFENHPGQNVFATPTDMVIIDVEKAVIVVRHPLSGEIREVLMDDRHIYWLYKAVNVLHRLELKPGGKHEEKPLQTAVEELFFLGDDELGMMTSEPQVARAVVLDRETLRPIPNHPLSKIDFPRDGHMRRERSNEVFSIGDGQLMFVDRLLNQSDGTTLCFPSRLPFVPYVTEQLVGWTGLSGFPGPDFEYLWRRLITAGGVYKLGARALFEWNDRLWDVSPSLPLAVTVSLTEPRGQQAIKLTMELRDLVFGQVLQAEVSPIRLVDTTGSRRMLSKVRFAGDHIVLATGDRVAVHRVPDEVRSKLLEPLRLQYPHADITAATKPVVLQLSAKGGKPPYRYSMQEEVTGVTLDAATGELELDLPKMWSQYIEQLGTGRRADLSLSLLPRVARGRQRTPTIDIPTNQQPLAAALQLTATDASGQSDNIAISYITYGPQNEAEANFKRAQNEMAARMRAQQRAAQRVQFGPENRDNDDKIDQRLDEIEARLEAIEQLLRKQNQ